MEGPNLQSPDVGHSSGSFFFGGDDGAVNSWEAEIIQLTSWGLAIFLPQACRN